MHRQIELREQPTGTTRIEVIYDQATDAAVLLRFHYEMGDTYDVLLNESQAADLGRFLKLAAMGA